MELNFGVGGPRDYFTMVAENLNSGPLWNNSRLWSAGELSPVPLNDHLATVPFLLVNCLALNSIGNCFSKENGFVVITS